MLEIGIFKYPEISVSELKANPGKVHAGLARHYGQARDVERKIAGEFTDVEPQVLENIKVASEIKAVVVSNTLSNSRLPDGKILDEIRNEISAMREEIVDSTPWEFKIKVDMSLEAYGKYAERAWAYNQSSPETFLSVLNCYDPQLDHKATK